MAGDERLFRRVAGTSILLVAGICVLLWALFSCTVSFGFGAGAAIGLASLWALDAVVSALAVPAMGSRRRRLLTAGALQIGKYGLIGAVLYVLLRFNTLNGPALAAGLTVPVGVLCIWEASRKAKGSESVRRRSESKKIPERCDVR